MRAGSSSRARDLTVVLRGARTAWSADRSGTAVATALQLLGALSALGVVLAGKLALEAITGGEARVDSRLVGSLALLALATAATGVASSLQRYQQRLLGERVSQRLWGTVLRTIARTDLITWESPAFVDRLERVSSNALSRPTSVVTSLLALAGSLFGVVGMTAALLLIHPVLVPALLLAGVPSVWFSRRAGAAEFTFARASNGSARRRLYYKQILLQRQDAAEVRAFGSAGWLVARHEQEDAEYLGLLSTHVRRRQVVALLSTCVAALALATTLVVIVVLVSRDSITLAEAGAAAIAARLLGGQLSTTFSALGSLIESAPFLADMESFLATSSKDEPAGRKRPLRHDLELCNVSFTYGGGHGLALDRVSIRIPRGSVVAVVGENGSGKTTLAKIVSGLYDPTSGTRSWDGDADVPAADVRASTTVLLQDFIRYQLTFADNVSVAQTVEPVDRSRIRSALEQVGLTEAVEALPGGLDTLLGKQFGEGTDLSGGQWQRLALARALYRDAPLVVLDEPTSALDPRAEHDLFADVRRVLDGRSALLISHRYSSVRLADHIYVMEGGHVLEEGSHDDLMALGGRYAELYTLQSAVYLR